MFKNVRSWEFTIWIRDILSCFQMVTALSSQLYISGGSNTKHYIKKQASLTAILKSFNFKMFQNVLKLNKMVAILWVYFRLINYLKTEHSDSNFKNIQNLDGVKFSEFVFQAPTPCYFYLISGISHLVPSIERIGTSTFQMNIWLFKSSKRRP